MNYSDLTRPIGPPKWWFSKGNPLILGKSRFVKYYNLARFLCIGCIEIEQANHGRSDKQVIQMMNGFFQQHTVDGSEIPNSHLGYIYI